MEFEWDDGKSDLNRAHRGFGFDFAALIFAGRTIESQDDRLEYGEVRMLAIGAVDEIELAVVYTDRGGVRRIISARRANRKERQAWQASA